MTRLYLNSSMSPMLCKFHLPLNDWEWLWRSGADDRFSSSAPVPAKAGHKRQQATKDDGLEAVKKREYAQAEAWLKPVPPLFSWWHRL